ncbi:hypothetical protein HOLleu_01720 [Holothuria leucospilota]|uniref:Chromo domain-containing protein n=1 Tax=Holothuria leucospilota TaxID=206669 RepID=A0A9Q1CR76_HOLLE|nr:hypothetical protein HOLleu_01720 [Holothuria leucospilota]
MDYVCSSCQGFVSLSRSASGNPEGSKATNRSDEKTKQNKRKSKRVKTLFKKAKELQDEVGCQVFIYITDQYNHIKFGGSPEVVKRYKEGTLSSEAGKKKEVAFIVKHPKPSAAKHSKSMWPGNLETSVAEDTEESSVDESFLEEGSSIAEDSVIDPDSPSETLITEEVSTEDKDELDTCTGEGTSGLTREAPGLQNTARTIENEDEDEPLSILKNILGGGEGEETPEEESVYTVAQVRRQREREGKTEYLVKWKGLGREV